MKMVLGWQCVSWRSMVATIGILWCSTTLVLAQSGEFPPLPDNPDRIQGSSQAFGVSYGQPATINVPITLDFNTPVPSPGSFSGTSILRDIKLTFITKHGDSAGNLNRTLVSINGVQRIATELYSTGPERSYEFILNRNLFSLGSNNIVFEPQNTQGSRPWGIRNISFEYLPAIELQLDEIESGSFGYNENPSRFTGLRANFNLTDLSPTYALDVVGWDIDQNDETQVFVNGVAAGFLSPQANQFNAGDTVVLPDSALVQGENQIEFVQKYPNAGFLGQAFEQWAVSQLLVKPVNADLQLASLEVDNVIVVTNRPIEVTVNISNIGDIPSSAGKLRFLRSDDPIITPQDTVLLEINLASIAAAEVAEVVQLVQVDAAARGAYIGACVSEIDNDPVTNNDCFSGPLLKSPTVSPFLLLLTDDE